MSTLFRMMDKSNNNLVRLSQEFGYGRYRLVVNAYSGVLYCHLTDEKKRKHVSFPLDAFKEMVGKWPTMDEETDKMLVKTEVIFFN